MEEKKHQRLKTPILIPLMYLSLSYEKSPWSNGQSTGLQFKLQSRYCVHFRTNTLGKVMNPFIAPISYGLNSTTTVLLQRWFWY